MPTDNGIAWYKELSDDLEYKTEEAKIAFAVELSKQLDLEGIIRSELADTIGSSPAYITKVLRGESNLTIESMIKLSAAAKGELHIHVTPNNSSMRWFGVFANRTEKSIETGCSWARTTRGDPLNELTGRFNERISATA